MLLLVLQQMRSGEVGEAPALLLENRAKRDASPSLDARMRGSASLPSDVQRRIAYHRNDIA